jgi:L-ascorbate metabolism protein UlaG (beta-lactamase superfamily)
MLIKWLGHSSFYIETEGHTILTDPFDESVRYPTKFPAADIVTVSHEHSDHNAIERVPNKKAIVRGNVEKVIDGIIFKGIGAFHDEEQGLKRGLVTIFRIEAEGISVVHLGDLGTTLTKEQIDALTPVNILLVPVGGYYTIDADHAHKVVESLNPNITIPMHYKTDYTNFNIKGVDLFLKGKKYTEKDYLDITKDTLPKENEIILLKLSLGA